MNYGQIKQNLISLGFAEDSDYEEFEDLKYTYDCINRAISQIQMQFPYLAKYEFEIDESDTGILYIDMTDIKGFLELANETPVIFEAKGDEVFRKFGDYQIEMGHTIVINAGDYAGSFRVYYNKACTEINEETPDTFVPELPTTVHHLIPLLAAYYLWLDDDERKAVQYYNMYETELGVILQKQNMPRMRVNTDWSRTGNLLNAFPDVTKDEWGRWY